MSDPAGNAQSARARLAAIRERLPFGMGTVAVLGSLALMIVAGVLLWGPPERAFDDERGLIRGYASTPETAWTLDHRTLPGYEAATGVAVAGFAGDQWLVSYPTGASQQETAFVLVDATTGDLLWDTPLDAGFGDCAITYSGTIGCAIDTPAEDGFYQVDRDSGTARRVGDRNGTTTVIAAGRDFLRLTTTAMPYTATMTRGDGREVWSRPLDAAPDTGATAARYSVIYLATTAGRHLILDPADGAALIDCTSCEIEVYPTGVAVAQQGTAAQQETGATGPSLSFHRLTHRGLSANPTAVSDGDWELVGGRSVLPVATGTPAAKFNAGHGDYWVIDPATGDALWRTDVDPEISKVHAMPCGDLFAVNTKSGDRTVYRLADGTRLGILPLGRGERRDENLDYLSCVGSANDLLVVTDTNRLSAFDAARGELAWYLDINGRVDIVDGYLVLRQGSELSQLRPN